MFAIKAIKFDDTEPSALRSWWIMSPLSEYYYNIIDFIQKPFITLKKLYDWQVNVFKNDFDFDGSSLFGIIEYKLKRLEKCLIDGCAVQDSKDLKALKLAIKLANRLNEDNYDNRFHRKHNQKWGELIMWSAPIEGSPSVRVTMTRPKAQTDKQKAKEQKEHLSHIEFCESIRKREERWLYSILAKYLRVWWD